MTRLLTEVLETRICEAVHDAVGARDEDADADTDLQPLWDFPLV